MTHTTFDQNNLSVSSAIVMSSFLSMSKRARDCFAASASAKQRPVDGTAMFVRKLNNNYADMDYHAVLPPNKAGGDSKREELCQQVTENFTITLGDQKRLKHHQPLGDRKPQDIRQALVSGKVHSQANSDEEGSIFFNSKIQEKALTLRTRRNTHVAQWF